jgi:archaellum component FlaC
MAVTMLWDRIVPSGKNAYFPFQLSASGLSPVATVYETDDASGADPTVSAGVSVLDNGGGLYALKVNAANMTADRTYYAVISAGNEGARIPLWAYAPTGHFADVLSKLTDVESDVAAVQADVDALQTEIGDVSGETWTGLVSVPDDVAGALSAIYLKAKGVQDDLDNGTDGLGALKSLIDTVDGNVDDVKTAVESATFGLSAIKSAVDGVGTTADNIETLLENATYGLSALQAEINDNQNDIATIDSNVDDIKTAVESATFGLSALKGHIDDVDTALATVDGNVDDIKAEIGDIGTYFVGAAAPTNVAQALKAIYDNLAGSDVWDDDVSGKGANTAGHALYQAWDILSDGTDGLVAVSDKLGTSSDTSATTTTVFGRIAAAKAQLVDIEADTTDIQSKIGSPAGASLSADIAAVKATVDTLAVQTNAVLLPFVPERIFSKSTEFRLSISVNVRDGETGALEDPDVLGTSPAGKVFVKAKNSTSGTSVAMYNAPSAGSLLSAADSSGANGFLNGFAVVPQNLDGSNSPIPGVFTLHAVIPAYHRDTMGFEFFCRDGDPSGIPQSFSTFRYLEVMSPISGSNGGGAF